MYDFLFYCGEEDLLAHYSRNYSEKSNKYWIGVNDEKSNSILIEEGGWENFIRHEQYKLRKQQNEKYNLWDSLIQSTCQNAFDGTVKGNGNIFVGQSAINEMAMEPRFMRRSLSHMMEQSINNFPKNIPGLARNISFMLPILKIRHMCFCKLSILIFQITTMIIDQKDKPCLRFRVEQQRINFLIYLK